MSDSFKKAFSLEGKRALVTGGGSGLGEAMAAAMAAAGAEVILVGRRKDVLEAAASRIPGARIETVDLSDIASLKAAAEGILERHGKVDILVNNAGNTIRKPYLETTYQDIDAVVDVHLRGSLEFSRPFIARQATTGGGSVIFTASMASYMGLPYVMGYSVAKTAILGAVRALSAEFAGQNVRVNGIAPGWIDTPLYRGATGADPARKAKALGRIQMGRIGEVEDVGWTSVFLASDAATYITGQTIAVDGGALAGF